MIRALAMLTAIVCCAALAAAQTPGPRFEIPVAESVTLPDRVEVPMKMRGVMPALEVMVNGQGPFLFGLDTGGMGLVRADSTLVERLSLPVTGSVQASDGTRTATRTMAQVRVDSMAFGGAVFRGLTGASRNYNTSPRFPHIDGILGVHLFSDALLTLDFPGRRIVLERGELPPADGRDVLALEPGRPVPAIQLEVGKQKILAHLDTGNMVGLLLPAAAIVDLAFASEPVVAGRGRSVAGEYEIRQARLVEPVRLGRHALSDTVRFAEVFPQGNIGSHALRDFVVTLDQKHGRVRLVRPATVVPPAVPTPR